MSIQLVRDAFIDAAPGARIDRCELHTLPAQSNAQRLAISGAKDGREFALLSEPFPAHASPIQKAREMALEVARGVGFRLPPVGAALPASGLTAI